MPMEFSQRRRVEFGADLKGAATRNVGQSLFAPTKNLRKPRHSGIFDAVHRFDTRLDPAAREALARWVREQYETEIGDIPLGFVAECHLGPPYVDHRLDLLQSIVDHFALGDMMPEPYAQARMLVRTGAYEFVEVYASGKLLPVRADGSVVA
jgi:hypothetical protein